MMGVVGLDQGPVTCRCDFDDVHGASLRAIFDLSNLDRSRFVIAGGQCGNPLSAHYADFTLLWRDGQYVTMVGADGNRLMLLPEVRR